MKTVVPQILHNVTEWDESWEIMSLSPGPDDEIVLTLATRIERGKSQQPDDLIAA
jgi:hypothetical protein